VAQAAAKILRDAWPRLLAADPGTPQPPVDQPAVIIDETTSRALRWMNKLRRKLGLPLRKI